MSLESAEHYPQSFVLPPLSYDALWETGTVIMAQRMPAGARAGGARFAQFKLVLLGEFFEFQSVHLAPLMAFQVNRLLAKFVQKSTPLA